MSSAPRENAAIAGVVDRPRLYSVLASPLVRVCIVQGPSGSGKTTLLRSWVLQRTQQEPLTWVSLNGEITSRQAFWQQVARSAARLGEMSEHTASNVQEQLALATDPVDLAADLLADFGPATLVIDAYEHLGAVTEQIDRDLQQLVARAPELRVLITTRARTALASTDPPGGVVRVIALSELALTADEVTALVEDQTGIRDPRLAASIVAATHGFPLSVRAVTLAISQLGAIPQVDSIEWDRVVAARLESLLPDPQTVRFVTDTSVPPYVDVALAEQLSEGADAARQLDMLERNGFGRWIPYTRNRQVFQYVETIRDTFRARARTDAARFRRLCLTTAAWLLENEEVVEHALQFALEGEDYALADRVFVSVVISNPDSYTSDRFLPNLLQVPEKKLWEYPMLAFGLGLALMANPVRRAEAPRIFQIAVEATAEPAYIHPQIDAFSHASMRAISRRLTRDWRSSGEAARAAVELAERIDPPILAQAAEHVGTVLRQLSFSLWMGGRIDDAIATAERSVSLCARPGPRDYSAVYVSGLNAFAGDTIRAAVVAESIHEDVWPATVRKTSMNSLGLLAEAYRHMDALDFPAAMESLRPTRDFLLTSEYWPLITTAIVTARHGLGQAHAEADRVTRELAAEPAPPGAGDNVATASLHAALARAWLSGGDAPRAEKLLAAFPETNPYLATARIAALLAAGGDDEAVETAERLIHLPDHTIRTRAELETIGAVAALRHGDAQRAEDWLTRAFVTWDAYGSRLHVALLDAPDRRRLWDFSRERRLEGLQRYLELPASLNMPRQAPSVSLTKREKVVLAALAGNDSIRAIADQLVVSPHTVKSQLRSIYRKLGASSRKSALRIAQDLGILELPDSSR